MAFLNLSDATIFQAFGGEEVWEKVSVLSNSIVVKEGDNSSDFYYVLSGNVLVLKGDQVLAQIGAGGFFGEVALLSEQARSAQIKAQTDCELYRLSKGSFKKLVQSDVQAAVGILMGIVQGQNERLVSMNKRLMTVYQVANVLRASGSGGAALPIIFQRLAEILGHGNLALFAADGVVKYQHPDLKQSDFEFFQMQVPSRAQALKEMAYQHEEGVLYLGIYGVQGELKGMLVAALNAKTQLDDLRLLVTVGQELSESI